MSVLQLLCNFWVLLKELVILIVIHPCINLPWLRVVLVNHIDERVLCKLSGILARHVLRVLKMLQQTFLLCVEVDILAEERVKLLPTVVLSHCVHGSHLITLGYHSRETELEVFFIQTTIELLKSMDVPFVVFVKLHMVFELRNTDMPQVEVLAKVL